MTILYKRLIFFSLLLLFFVYTWVVATSGTAIDKGASYFSEDAAKGKLLFQEYNCGSCHQLYGLGGYMGPDLTNVISAKGKGEQYARAIISSGTAKMPDFMLSHEQVDQLVSFLRYIDKTGVSPVYNYKIEYDGTVGIIGEK